MSTNPKADRLTDALATHEASRLLGVEQGRAEERAACVAFILAHWGDDMFPQEIARAIERGEHVRPNAGASRPEAILLEGRKVLLANQPDPSMNGVYELGSRTTK